MKRIIVRCLEIQQITSNVDQEQSNKCRRVASAPQNNTEKTQRHLMHEEKSCSAEVNRPVSTQTRLLVSIQLTKSPTNHIPSEQRCVPTKHVEPGMFQVSGLLNGKHMLSPHAITFPKWQNLRCMQITTGAKEGSHVCQVLFYFFEKPDRNSSVKVT